MNQILWKPIPGYEGLYKINIDGKIVSLHKKNVGKEISQSISNKGYWIVRLSKKSKQSALLVHRLLSLAFIDNPEDKKFVNHKNGNKLDYRICNLEWVTGTENMQHAYKFGLCNKLLPKCKPLIDDCSGKKYKSIKLAANDLGITYSTLRHYLSGRRENKTCLEFAA